MNSLRVTKLFFGEFVVPCIGKKKIDNGNQNRIPKTFTTLFTSLEDTEVSNLYYRYVA